MKMHPPTPHLQVSCYVKIFYRQRSCWKGSSIHKNTFWISTSKLSFLVLSCLITNNLAHSNLGGGFGMAVGLNTKILPCKGTYLSYYYYGNEFFLRWNADTSALMKLTSVILLFIWIGLVFVLAKIRSCFTQTKTFYERLALAGPVIVSSGDKLFVSLSSRSL